MNERFDRLPVERGKTQPFTLEREPNGMFIVRQGDIAILHVTTEDARRYAEDCFEALDAREDGRVPIQPRHGSELVRLQNGRGMYEWTEFPIEGGLDPKP